MTRIQFQTELDIQQFVSQLDIAALETFSKEIDAAIARKKQKDKEQREKKLIQQLNIDCVLSPESWNHFQILIKKREAEPLSVEEQKELQLLIQEEEQLRLKRVEILGELSKIKNIPLLELMKQMDIQAN
ncbi:MAG: hypothetical protein AAFO82_17150 [Bacteroidota bacterium]